MPAQNTQLWIKTKGIGLTGGVATGKSTVANILRDLGYRVLDADHIARSVVEPGRPAYHDILREFGPDLVLADRTLDRKKLGSLIWGVPAKKERLEELTHPRIKEEFINKVRTLRQENEKRFFFYEAALLFEAGRAHEFYKIVCTWCPENVQIQRLMTRNQISDIEARAIISSQMSASNKKEKSDFTILTNCPEKDLQQRVSNTLDLLNNSDS